MYSQAARGPHGPGGGGCGANFAAHDDKLSETWHSSWRKDIEAAVSVRGIIPTRTAWNAKVAWEKKSKKFYVSY